MALDPSHMAPHSLVPVVVPSPSLYESGVVVMRAHINEYIAPSLRKRHFRADWSSEGFTRCSLSTPMRRENEVKKCTLLPKERALFDMAHAELVGLERTLRKTYSYAITAYRRDGGRRRCFFASSSAQDLGESLQGEHYHS